MYKNQHFLDVPRFQISSAVERLTENVLGITLPPNTIIIRFKDCDVYRDKLIGEAKLENKLILIFSLVAFLLLSFMSSYLTSNQFELVFVNQDPNSVAQDSYDDKDNLLLENRFKMPTNVMKRQGTRNFPQCAQ